MQRYYSFRVSKGCAVAVNCENISMQTCRLEKKTHGFSAVPPKAEYKPVPYALSYLSEKGFGVRGLSQDGCASPNMSGVAQHNLEMLVVATKL